MNYLTFRKKLEAFPVFSLKDIHKMFPTFDRRRLSEWTNRGLLIKVRRGYYAFSELKPEGHLLSYIANKLYAPSYVSLESALMHYGFIPEGVFGVYSITSLNTAQYDTPFGHFSYRHLKPSLFFGYRILISGDIQVKIADPEKALLDFLYLSTISTIDEMQEMRFNSSAIIERVSEQRMEQYLNLINSQTLRKRVQTLNRLIHA